jgi:hypothetical protein
METIKELLNKRTIADSTKKVYIKKLEMLHKGLGVEGTDDFGFIKDTDRTMEWINQFNSAKKRTLFNACMVALSPASRTIIPEDVAKEYKFYSDAAIDENKAIGEVKMEQKKNEKEDDNWATMKELKRVLKTYANALKVKGFIPSPFSTNGDKNTLQKLLVGSLYIMHPPRRLEYGNMVRINHEDYSAMDNNVKETNNFIVNKTKYKWYFSFGDVKVKQQKAQIVPLHKDLIKIVKLWYASTPDAISFLLTRSGQPQSSNGLSHFIRNNVFEPTGKMIGAGMLRKIYLSEKYAGDTPLAEKMETAELMNHSVSTADLHYTKKD